ncbi:MAG TPA: hypothetical protein VNV65_07080 [Candidatus Solibacter sp.]|jgi:hypothetical protein|nr:hypothetical protein [Candidatus Solibacter sp.]
MIDEPAVQATPTPALWESLPPPPVAAAGHLVRNLLIVVAAVVVLIGVAVGYVVASRAAAKDRIDASNAVRSTVDQRHVDFEAKLRTVFSGVGDLSGTNFDPARAKTALDQANVELDSLKSTDETEIRDVATADRKVQDRSMFTAISASMLDREHGRLGAYHDGLVAEISVIGSVKQQIGLISDLMTTLVELKTLSADLTAQKVSTAEADYAAPSASLDKLITGATAAPDTPSKLKEFLAVFRSELTHIKGVVDGVQNRNLSAIETAQAALKIDIDALEKFDYATLQKQYQDLGTQLDAKVTANFSRAK